MIAFYDDGSFHQATGVSRETLDKLRAYAALLEKWQRSINLVSSATLPELWRRHFADSAQLAPLIGTETSTLRCVDLGSGAGFPGLVLAIMGIGQWTLIDSDRRKLTFLQEAARITRTSVTLLPARLEQVTGLTADIVTARACASLETLLGYATPLLEPSGKALFLKGRDAAREIDEARKTWNFEVRRIPSQTDPEASIVEIRNVSST
ncbi:16S rRNA (guanine(527)-N(7))-methyltransferase RsmG [Iodidimonas sp. SYSU 1G8]